jgi:hypothetical protein
LLLRSADEACVGVALRSSCSVDILATLPRDVGCNRPCHANTDAQSFADGRILTRRLCACFTQDTFIWSSPGGGSAARLRVSENTWARCGRQGGLRLRCEGDLPASPSRRRVLFRRRQISLIASPSHPAVATQHSKVRGRLAQRRLRYLFLPPHSPPFHAREEWWA